VHSTMSGIQAVSRLSVNITDDTVYVCRWSSAAGSADDLTSIVSVITGEKSHLDYLINLYFAEKCQKANKCLSLTMLTSACLQCVTVSVILSFI